MSIGHSIGAKNRDLELEALKAKVEHLGISRVYPAPELTNIDQVDIPFSDAIIEADFLESLKARIIKKCDGRTNLEDHLTTFQWHMNTLSVGQLACCKLFSITCLESQLDGFVSSKIKRSTLENRSRETSYGSSA